MADIVDSLFGLSPYQIQQQQNQQLSASADRYAQQDPFQRAAGGMYRAGGMLAGPAAEAMGMVNPQVQQAQVRSAVMGQGGDLTTAAGLKAKAAQFAAAGDQATAMKLILLARKQEQEQQEIALKRATELAQLHKAQSEASQIAKLNPKDYTPESWAEYVQSKDTSKLRAVTAEGKFSSMARELIDAGYEYGTPEFAAEMKKRIAAETTGKAKGAGATFVMPGAKDPIDILKFRDKAQETIKPHLDQVNAVDTANAALKEAMKGNFIAFQGAQQQLARAFSDQNISKSEVAAAGGDPSLVGASVDYISKMISGTPSMDTMRKMEATLLVARKNASKKASTELNQQKVIGRIAKIPDETLDELLRFKEFDEPQGIAVGETRTLKSGKKVQRVN